VWQQVRALERELKVTLLRQGGRGVELTPEGELLRKIIQPHVSGLDSLGRLFEAQRRELPQSLVVGSTPYLISHRLPGPVVDFTRRHPSVRLLLRAESWTDEVAGQVHQRQVDLGVVPYHPDESRHPDLDYQDLFELQFTLLAARDHPLARKRRVSAQDLVQYPLIRGVSFNQTALDNVLRRHDLVERMHVVMENGNTDIVLKYVALGVGVAVLFIGADAQGGGEVHARPFDVEGTPRLRVALLTRKGAHLSPHAQDFCHTLREHVAHVAGGKPVRRGAE
jgi:DNA-binding transcriptional LysR family regulator